MYVWVCRLWHCINFSRFLRETNGCMRFILYSPSNFGIFKYLFAISQSTTTFHGMSLRENTERVIFDLNWDLRLNVRTLRLHSGDWIYFTYYYVLGLELCQDRFNCTLSYPEIFITPRSWFLKTLDLEECILQFFPNISNSERNGFSGNYLYWFDFFYCSFQFI